MSRRRAPESGFLLIGVVMFVLALTILGLSLYSLSSYEADFQGASRDSDAAFYDAQSGLVMVQALLTRTDSLASARSAIGHWNIVWATAMQHRATPTVHWDSTGTVNTDSTVWVTVVANRGTQTHTLTARFLPGPSNNPYKRLLTITNQITIENGTGGGHANTVALTGDVWQAGPDTSWTLQCNPVKNPWTHTDPLRRDPLATPDLGDYFAEHQGSATNVLVQEGTDENYRKVTLIAPGPDPAYFTVQNLMDTHFGDLGLFVGKELDVYVKGTVIWLVPAGVYFSQGVNVHGLSGNDVLVVVALPGHDEDTPDLSIWFQGGIMAGVPMILASAGTITLEAAQGFINQPNAVDNLSILSKNVVLMGPLSSSGFLMTLTYDATRMNPLIDALPPDCLPQPPGATTSAFTLVRGSWRDLTP